MLVNYQPLDRDLLHHLLAYAVRANSRPGEGKIRFRRKQPLARFVSVLLLRQVLYGSENYGLVQTGIRMVMRNERYGLASIGNCDHCILPVAIGSSGVQRGHS